MNRTKDKSRNIIFIIICLLSNGLYAETNKNQEIGEPYFSFVTHRHITLAPDGKTFYALEGKKAVVSRYQLSPFKKIDSFKVPKLKSPYGPTSASRILISDDGKKLFFYNPKSLMLFDLVAKKILKKVEFDRFGDGAVLSKDRIITLFNGKYSNTPYGDDNVYTFIEFRNWNSNDLSKINTVSYFKGRKHAKTRIKLANKTILINIGDYVLFALFPKEGFTTRFTQKQPSLAIFDRNTLETRFVASFQDIRRSDWASNLRFSHDFSKVYVLNAEFYNARAFPNSRYQTPSSKDTLEIDLNTLKRKVLTIDWKEIESTTVGLHVVAEGKSSLHFSQAGNYASWWNYLFDAVKHEESIFYLFPDGEAVLQNKETKRFVMTKNARKHLEMKNPEGRYVPMNDATLMKYNMMGAKP